MGKDILDIFEPRKKLLFFSDLLSAEIAKIKKTGEGWEIWIIPTLDLKHKYQIGDKDLIEGKFMYLERESDDIYIVDPDSTTGSLFCFNTLTGEDDGRLVPKLIRAELMQTLKETRRENRALRIKNKKLQKDLEQRELHPEEHIEYKKKIEEIKEGKKDDDY